ncbi:DEAD-box ATP-dependent RNA helicase 51 [Camellia lanceoleosa]|uniref:DEAD-box ATP-dependent RNA helicase 51 n=1 Tax=Camellia lanceoleosa TaxID=1840588 RepID=A0ACC0IWW0_9ERIC|nr:DEAD-box ATP-dependent RNA helicase 51 [Camellia lanceoleosa]
MLDDGSDSSLAFSPKRRKLSYTIVEKVDKNEKFIKVVDCEDKEDDDWLPPSPKVSADTLKLDEDSTIKELRLEKCPKLMGFHNFGVEDLARLSFQTTPVYIDVDDGWKKVTNEGLQQGYCVVPSAKRFILLYSFLKRNLSKKVMIYSFDFYKAQKGILLCTDGATRVLIFL